MHTVRDWLGASTSTGNCHALPGFAFNRRRGINGTAHTSNLFKLPEALQYKQLSQIHKLGDREGESHLSQLTVSEPGPGQKQVMRHRLIQFLQFFQRMKPEYDKLI